MRAEMEYIYMAYMMGSFSKAAQALYITQPTLSLAVQRVEAELGCQIFDRNSHPVSLTPAGEIYMEHINSVRELEQSMQHKLDGISRAKDTVLRLGGTPMHTACLMPRVIARYNEIFPAISITMVSGFPHEQLRMLANNEIDMAISTEGSDKNDRFFRIPAFRVHYLMAVPPEMPVNGSLEEAALSSGEIMDRVHLKGLRPRVPLSRFADTPFILLTEGSDFYTRSCQLFAEAGFEPINRLQVSQPSAAYRMAKSGIGATLVGSMSLERDDRLRYYMLDSQIDERQFYFVLRSEAEMTQAQREFVEAFQHSQIADN